MLGATEVGAMLLSAVLAAGVCSEQPTRASERTRPEMTTGSFIVSAYVWPAHRRVSHTPWDTCK